MSRNARSVAARLSATDISSRSQDPRSCGPRKTAQAVTPLRAVPSSSCHAPPGTSDHRSNHGSTPAHRRFSATRTTVARSREL
jgi:hypothetical protein